VKTIYNGYGEVRENHDGTVYMKPAPPPPRTPDNQGQISPTRACLVVSERPVSPARRRLGTEQLLETYSVACTMATLSQTRTDEKPHPWEVAWFLWDLAPNKPDQQGDTGNSGYNFYALCVKPNGWELSKQDDKYKGSQRFLASGAYPRTVVPNPSSPVRARVDVSRIVGASVTMRVWAASAGSEDEAGVGEVEEQAPRVRAARATATMARTRIDVCTCSSFRLGHD